MTEFHTRKTIDNSHLVRSMAPRRMRELARMAGCGALIAFVALLYAWQHFECIQLGCQLEALKSQQAQAAELNQELKLEIAGLRAPSRIDEIARRELGLTAPVPGQFAPTEAQGDPVVAEIHPAGSARPQ